MNITAIIIAAVVVGCVGIILGLFLGISGEKFKVEVDPREEAIGEVLPGNNCGGCGYAGCSGLAAAIVKGEAPVGQCPVGGDPVAAQVAEIMSVEAVAGNKMVAFVKCSGDCDKSKTMFDYTGVEDCSAMPFVPAGGPNACDYGCLGYGSCVKACPFNAIHVENGLAKVDVTACKACGKCVAACPKKLIELVPYDSAHLIKCNSNAKGKDVMQACAVGCISCHLCEKNCPEGAIIFTENVPSIDQDKCTNCGTCVTKCPRKIIL